VRMAYWRQWRKPRTKVRSLMKLGVCVFSQQLRVASPAKAHGVALKLPAYNRHYQMLILKLRV
jgi:RNA-directed DNA polymerase